MKRIVFLISLAVSTGCGVLLRTDKADTATGTSRETVQEAALHTGRDVPGGTAKDAPAVTTPESRETAQEAAADTARTQTPPDTTAITTPAADSIPAAVSTTDTLHTDTVRKKGLLEAVVEYSAKDSIVWTAGNMAYLYGDGDVKYQNIELKSETIQMSMDNSSVYATHGTDSLGEEFGYPVFKEGEQDIEAKIGRAHV